MSATMDAIYGLAVSIGVVGLVTDSVVKLAPPPVTADFFEVAEIRAERNGDDAAIWVDRIIHRSIYMTASVRVMQPTPHGMQQVCIADGPTILYRPEAVMPQPVDLDWWTWGHCPMLPEGRTVIETTWTPRGPALEPVTVEVTVE